MGMNLSDDGVTDFGEDVTLKPLSIHPIAIVSVDTVRTWKRWLNPLTPMLTTDKPAFEELMNLTEYPEGTVFEIYATQPKEEEKNTH